MVGLDSPWHWLILVAVLLLLFGSKKLPEIGRSLGQGMREFKDSVTGLSGDSEEQSPAALNAATQAPERSPSQDPDSIS